MSIGLRIGPQIGNDIGPSIGGGEGGSSSSDTTLTVAIVESGDPIVGTSNFSYAVTVENTGSNAAENVECVIDLDAALTYVSAVGTGWTCGESGGLVTCTRAALDVGAAPDITVTVTPTNVNDTVVTTADVDADNAPAAAQDSESTTITGQASLSVAITEERNVTMTLEYIYYDVVVTVATNTATNLTCLVTLDPQMTYQAAAGTGWSCGHSGGVVTCTRASGSVGAQPTIRVEVLMPAAAETSTLLADADADNAPAAAQDSETTTVLLVTKDTVSGRRVPVSSAEWDNLITRYSLAVAAPTSLWGFQETSGSIADAIGSLTLTANGTPGYDQAVTGWTRKGVGFTDGAAAQRFMAAAAAGPNPTTTSQTWMFYASCTATPAAVRTVMCISDTGATQHQLRVTTGPVMRLAVVNVNTDGADSPTNDGIQPWVLKYDRTNSEAKAYTALEKLTGTYSAGVLDGRKGIGAAASSAVTGQCIYGAMWSGANGEISDANMKLMLQALGWTIAWS